jgi:hypothetical protein
LAAVQGRIAFAIALGLGLASALAVSPHARAADAARGGETVRLFPDGPDHWGMRNVLAPLTSLVLGPRYWYGERRIEVETTPPDATIDLFYVRGGFQKRFEQAAAPVTVIVPKRIDANPRDVVIVRAFAEGHRIREASIKVSSRTDRILLEMEPLPNLLEAVSHTYFAGRSALSFLTREALTLRIQQKDDGLTVALNETARSEKLGKGLAGIGGPLVGKLESHQLGEDLVVQIEYGPAAKSGKPEVRSRQGHDSVRDLHVYTLDLIAPGAGSDGVQATRAALERIRSEDVTGCAASFDRALRAALDAAALNRALAPSGGFIDPYLRAAMKRLGEVSPGGVIELADGTQYHPGVPLQLAAALNQAADARGYLALLRRLVALLEPESQRTAVLRGLVAPELPPEEFAAALESAQARERACDG